MNLKNFLVQDMNYKNFAVFSLNPSLSVPFCITTFAKKSPPKTLNSVNIGS